MMRHLSKKSFLTWRPIIQCQASIRNQALVVEPMVLRPIRPRVIRGITPTNPAAGLQATLNRAPDPFTYSECPPSAGFFVFGSTIPIAPSWECCVSRTYHQPREGTEMPKMPDKNPDLWITFMTALREYGLVMGLTFVLSYIRIRLYSERKSMIATILEAAFGALLIMLIGLGINAMGLNVAWTLFSAAFIGLLGVDQIRALAQKWASRKVEG
nr:phage holin family protein [Pseudomonas sp. DG56-2]